MTKQAAFRYLFVYLGLMALGLFIAFKVWWTPTSARFLGLLSLFLVFGGLLQLCFSLTRLLVTTETGFSFSTFNNKVHYRAFQSKVGPAMARKVSLISTLLILTLGGITVYSFIRFINYYEESQLREYGIIQKVRIKEIDSKGKGPDYAAFDYRVENKVYSNDLEQKDFAVGDSVDIIFSSQNPDIIQWAEEFETNN